MATQEKTWNVANRLHSQKDSDNPEVNHIIAGADEIYDDAKGAKQSDINAQADAALADRYTKTETYSKEQLDSLITTPDVNYVSVVATDATTAVTDILPATGEANTIYRVGNWDGTQYDLTMYALYAWNGSAYVCLAVRSFVGEVYDVSVNHPDGQGNPTPYADLTKALGTGGANIPANIRRGGMRIQFIKGTVQSNDNKYVQYRLTKDEWSTVTSDWVEADSNKVDNKIFYVTDGARNIIAKIDKDGVHSVDFKIGSNGDSVAEAINGISGQISSAVNAEKLLREQGDTTVTGLVEAEEARAKAAEDTKLNYTIADDKFIVTDNNGYIICQIDASGVHSVNIDENPNTIHDNKIIITDNNGYIICKIDSEGVHAPNISDGTINDNNITITDSNGYIIAKIDANGVHSAKDKHSVACMVLSESYYPIAAPTRDSDGNVTHAEVMFETGIAGSISITYTNGNSSSVAVVYGNYNYTISINRDTNGNVETVNVQ